MTVAENVFLGREPGNGAFVSLVADARRDARGASTRIGLDLDPMMLVSDLSVAEQQMVEIARALSRDARMIVMDEPTSALTEPRSRAVRIIARAEGARPRHHLRHPPPATRCCEICDRVTVLRDGRVSAAATVAEFEGRRSDAA